jgi:DNA polymerase-1
MIEIDRWLLDNNPDSKIIMQVHDELVFEIPEAETDAITVMARALMCGVTELNVPLVVDIGTGLNWKEAH